MRARLLAWGTVAWGLASCGTAIGSARADFDPRGRGQRAAPSSLVAPARSAAGSKGRLGAAAASEAGTDKEALFRRYHALLLKDPCELFPLQRLAKLYRERDGSLDELLRELRERLEAPVQDSWEGRVALAGAEKQAGHRSEALRLYREAAEQRPREGRVLLLLAQLEAEGAEWEVARAHQKQAVALLQEPAARDAALRSLRTYCLEAHDWQGAKEAQAELVRGASTPVAVRAELGTELSKRGEHARAEEEFRALVASSAGDARALGPALIALGQALGRQRKLEEATRVFEQALAVLGPESGLRAQVLDAMLEAYRAEGRLGELVPRLEAEAPRDFPRLSRLAEVYEETGAVDKAIATYRRALGADGGHVDTRLRLVHLLQTAGALDLALSEYERLLQADPENPKLVFELCEAKLQRGDRPAVLKLLHALENGASEDDDVLLGLVDFYERIEEKARAFKLLERLARRGGADSALIVELGDRYFQSGDSTRALETWARLRRVIPQQAQASIALGEVYLDHGLWAEALRVLREAVAQAAHEPRAKKALALALERMASASQEPGALYGEAAQLWELLLRAPQRDARAAREARTHLVTVWGLLHRLESEAPRLQSLFQAQPRDLEAGWLLAEVQRKTNRLPEAETTLRELLGLAPGEVEARLQLERILVQQQRLAEAIEVLKGVIQSDPARARECYQRMAQYASQLYREEDALRWTAQAVDLSPGDAVGHQKLAALYRRRQELPTAIAQLRQAISKDDRLYAAYIELAELLVATGQSTEADLLLRRVVRSCPDDALVVLAARTSLQLELARGEPRALEGELLPLAVAHPERLLFRRLLVDLYGVVSLPWLQALRGVDLDEAARARTHLEELGTRALKPLLDALGDERPGQQRLAIELLSHVRNRAAGPALFTFAVGAGDRTLRLRAMLAASALNAPELLPRYEALLDAERGATPGAPSTDGLAPVAAWAVSRLPGKRSERLLMDLLAHGTTEVRSMAALGLGSRATPSALQALLAVVRGSDSNSLVRAAALQALGARAGAGLEGARTLALQESESVEPMVRSSALVALAQLSAGGEASQADKERAVERLCSSVLDEDEDVRLAALRGLVELGRARATASSQSHAETLSLLPSDVTPAGFSAASRVRDGWKSGVADPDAAQAFVAFAAPLARAVGVALQGPSGASARVLSALRETHGNAGLATLLLPPERAPDELRAELAQAREVFTAQLVEPMLRLTRHTSVALRLQALQFLRARPEPSAHEALVMALADRDESVRQAVLSWFEQAPARGPEAAGLEEALSRLCLGSADWAVRVQAAQALGVALRGRSTGSSGLLLTLQESARRDSYALVREASLRSLATVSWGELRPFLESRAVEDVEARVRETARSLLALLQRP